MPKATPLRLMIMMVAGLSAAASAQAKDARELLQQANGLTAHFLESVAEMVNIDSPTYFMPGIGKMTEVIERRMRDLGAETKVAPASAEKGNNYYDTDTSAKGLRS